MSRLNLFRSIFGGGESRGRYPESLIEMAIERSVDATDARLRLMPGYRKRLREPVVHAIDHVVELVDGMPAPLAAGPREYVTDPRLAALFSSAADMLDILGRDTELTDFLASPEGTGSERVTALLLCERAERGILGIELEGDQVRRDVPQVTVSFGTHRLLDPSQSESESRRQWKRRAFDHLLSLALARIGEARIERADLARQRELVKRKLAALERGGWGLEAAAKRTDRTALVAELDTVEEQLSALGADRDLLRAHLGILAEMLGEAERQLWAEPLTLFLDPMNIRREAGDRSARRIDLVELQNSRGRRAVMLPLTVAPAELPEREDFLAAAQRYLQ